MFPAPILLLAGPLILALLIFPLRRWPRVAAGAGMAAVLLLWLMTTAVPLTPTPALPEGAFFAGDTWLIYGRSLILSEGVREAFLFIYAVTGLLFALSIALPQGRNFTPATLIVLAPLAATLMIRPFILGALSLLVAAGLLAVLIQADRTGSTQVALRCLLMAALALPLLLVAGWMLETDALAFSASIARLTAVGLVILLAGFPFHIWVAPVLSESPPLTAVVAFGLTQLVIVLFGLNLLLNNPWLQQHPAFSQTVYWSGGLTVMIAAFLAYHARTFGSLLGYLVLMDIGATLLAMVYISPDNLQALLSLLFLRLASLILAGVGLSLIRRHRPGSQFESAQGLAWQLPVGVALFLYGSLSLAGFPLTPGFSGRWAVIALISQQSTSLAGLSWTAWALLLAAVSGVVGLLRCLASLLAPGVDPQSAPDSPWVRGTAVVILAAGLFLAIFPQTLLIHAARLAQLLR